MSALSLVPLAMISGWVQSRGHRRCSRVIPLLTLFGFHLFQNRTPVSLFIWMVSPLNASPACRARLSCMPRCVHSAQLPQQRGKPVFCLTVITISALPQPPPVWNLGVRDEAEDAVNLCVALYTFYQLQAAAFNFNWKTPTWWLWRLKLIGVHRPRLSTSASACLATQLILDAFITFCII